MKHGNEAAKIAFVLCVPSPLTSAHQLQPAQPPLLLMFLGYLVEKIQDAESQEDLTISLIAPYPSSHKSSHPAVLDPQAAWIKI